MIQNSLFKTTIGWKGLPVFYIKRQEGERELNGGETDRECVRGRALWQEGDSVGNKSDH